MSMWNRIIKIDEKTSRIYKNLLCKGEPYTFSGQRDPSLHTVRHPVTFILRVNYLASNFGVSQGSILGPLLTSLIFLINSGIGEIIQACSNIKRTQ